MLNQIEEESITNQLIKNKKDFVDIFKEHSKIKRLNDVNTLLLNNTIPTEIPTPKVLKQYLILKIPIYRISLLNLNKIGSGVSGTVYKYEPLQDIDSMFYTSKLKKGISYAIKKPTKQMTKSVEFMDFYMETISLYNITSQYVIKCIGVSFLDDDICIIYEYCNGIDLRVTLRTRPGPGPTITDNIIRQIAYGIRDIHKAGILHRDLKPENIMICDDVVKIIDFGLSHIASNPYTSVRGTLKYTAPEVFSIKTDQTHTNTLKNRLKSDIYSFGIILNEVLTGQKPFSLYFKSGKTVQQFINAIHSMRPRKKLNELSNKKLNEYNILIEKCWHGDVEKRPTAEKLVAEIERIQGIH